MPRSHTKKQLNLFVTREELKCLDAQIERLSKGAISQHRIALLALRVGLPIVSKMERDAALAELVRGEAQSAEGQPVT